MSIVKQLASQTAIYGLTSIVGRLINYLLTPLLTATFAFAPAEYGIITELYAYITFLIIILALGLETAYFRFANKPNSNPKEAFSASFIPASSFGLLFFLVVLFTVEPIASAIGYQQKEHLVLLLAGILLLDNLSAIPMASLRLENKAKRFAAINLISIFTNLVLVVLFIGVGKRGVEAGSVQPLIHLLYKPEIGVAYVFIANLIASAVKLLLLSGSIVKNLRLPKWNQIKLQLIYGLPLLIAGLGGMINETVDRVLLKQILSPIVGMEEAMFQLGIYGANYKIAILIALFLQAFRYAAEPFFFANSTKKDAGKMYALVLDYLLIFLVFCFLVIVLYLEVFKFFIPNSIYWQGLQVVPILVFAKLLLGLFYSQSIWYKLSEKTMYGAVISFIGAGITIALNFLLVPKMGYIGCAWATLAAYASMLLISQVWGQRVYPVPYRFSFILITLLLAVSTYFASVLLANLNWMPWYVTNTILFLGFTGIMILWQGKYFLTNLKT